MRGRQLDGCKFTKQFPIGSVVADFACRSAKLVVDGEQHDMQRRADAQRTRMIESYGYKLLRYWNSDISGNLEGVLADILRHLRIASGEPSP